MHQNAASNCDGGFEKRHKIVWCRGRRSGFLTCEDFFLNYGCFYVPGLDSCINIISFSGSKGHIKMVFEMLLFILCKINKNSNDAKHLTVCISDT